MEYRGRECQVELSGARAGDFCVARVKNDPNYEAYRKGRKKILLKVRELLQAAGFDLSLCAGIPEHTVFQRYLLQYRIVVYSGLRCDNIMFDGQVAKPQRINLLYDWAHYHVITNRMTAMAKRYICLECNKWSSWGAQHRCDAPCDACSGIPFVSRTTLGSPAMSATDTLGMPRALRITNVSRNRTRLCVKPRNRVASVVFKRERSRVQQTILFAVSKEKGVEV